VPTFETEYQEGVDMYIEAVDKGEADLIDDGFPPALRPKNLDGEWDDYPQLPTPLSSLGMAQLQDLIGRFTAWHSYALELLPDAVARKNSIAGAKEFAWSKIRRSYKGTVSDKDDQARVDSRYVELNSGYETAAYRASKLKAIVDGLNREIETVSRAITALADRGETEGRGVGGIMRANQVRGVIAAPKKDVLNGFRRRRRGE